MAEAMEQIPGAAHFIACQRAGNDDILVSLKGNLTIAEVMPLRGQLQEVLCQERPVTLDGGAIEKIDTAALQLLWAFCREITRRQLSVQWSEASGTLLQAATLLGLADTMGLAARSG